MSTKFQEIFDDDDEEVTALRAQVEDLRRRVEEKKGKVHSRGVRDSNAVLAIRSEEEDKVPKDVEFKQERPRRIEDKVMWFNLKLAPTAKLASAQI